MIYLVNWFVWVVGDMKEKVKNMGGLGVYFNGFWREEMFNSLI